MDIQEPTIDNFRKKISSDFFHKFISFTQSKPLPHDTFTYTVYGYRNETGDVPGFIKYLHSLAKANGLTMSMTHEEIELYGTLDQIYYGSLKHLDGVLYESKLPECDFKIGIRGCL